MGEFAHTDYILSPYSIYLNLDNAKTYDDFKSSVYADFDNVAPLWRNMLQAYKNDTLIILPQEKTLPLSFAASHYVLDLFEQHAK